MAIAIPPCLPYIVAECGWWYQNGSDPAGCIHRFWVDNAELVEVSFIVFTKKIIVWDFLVRDEWNPYRDMKTIWFRASILKHSSKNTTTRIHIKNRSSGPESEIAITIVQWQTILGDPNLRLRLEANATTARLCEQGSLIVIAFYLHLAGLHPLSGVSIAESMAACSLAW